MSNSLADTPHGGPGDEASGASAIDADTLVAHALRARQRAYAPYSHYQVGAALLTAGGDVVYGCNVENAAYPDTICAERVALTSAVAMGHREFAALAVATRDGGTPCGSCRQVMAELAQGSMPVYISDEFANYRTTSVAELLPQSFSSASLTPSAAS